MTYSFVSVDLFFADDDLDVGAATLDTSNTIECFDLRRLKRYDAANDGDLVVVAEAILGVEHVLKDCVRY